MMMPSMTRAALLVALMIVAPAAAATGPRELTTTAVARGLPAAKVAPDIYYFAGETGAKETYTLTIKGPASLTLFTPDGHEMVTATGSGNVTLTAYLPLTDVFTLAVSRLTPGQPYTLSRKATLPTLAEEEEFSNVGYTLKNADGFYAACWIAPGVKVRGRDAKQIGESLLAADRETVSRILRRGSETISYEVTYSLVGGVLMKDVRWPDGKVDRHPTELRATSLSDRLVREWSGYRCAD